MAKTKDTTTEVVEYDDDVAVDDDGELLEEDALAQTSIDPDAESYTAETADGEEVEIAVTEAQRNEAALIRGQLDDDGVVVQDRDFPGKEEDAELAQRQHELGIDNQLIDPND